MRKAFRLSLPVPSNPTLGIGKERNKNYADFKITPNAENFIH